MMVDEWGTSLGKRITLRFHGRLEDGFQIFWDIRTPSDHLIADGDGALPLAPHLDWHCEQWRNSYGELLGRLPTDWQDQPRAIKPTGIKVNGSLHDQQDRCAGHAMHLSDELNQWLASATFASKVEKFLVAHVRPIEDIHILIRTDDVRLHYFPWHEWAFLDRYPQAEIGIAPKSFSLNAPAVSANTTSETAAASNPVSCVNVLAIFGDGEGLDLSKDEAILSQLPNTTLTVLKDCTRETLIDALDRQPWTILFFAGHGEKSQEAGRDQETGWLYLNALERISLEELRYSLRGAIDRGLQVAIFNSCQGMGLAYALAPLNMPSMVVMREEIPDTVAQRFLGYFLKAFAEESPLFLAVRRAREQVRQLMDPQFPGVSGLPIIWQSPATKPMEWPPPARRIKWWQPVLTTVGAIALTIGLRYLGVLQPLELNAYDHLMQIRPGEGRDRRLLVVAVSEEDIQYQRDQRMDLAGSLSDDALGLLLQKLKPHQPSVIGLDIFHDFPFQGDVQTQIDPQHFIAICRARSASSQLAGIAPPSPDYPAESLGFNNVPFDADGVIRRQLLGMEAGEICPTPQAFNLRVAQVFLNQQADIGLEWVETSSTRPMQIKLGQQVFSPLGHQSGGYHLSHRDLGGYQILINYRSRTPETVHLREILSGSLDSQLTELVRDRIILIGVVDPKIDTHLTPYSQRNESRRVPGVIVQAHMISQIIGAALGERSLLRWWPEWLEILWISSWAVVGSSLVWLKRMIKAPRFPFSLPPLAPSLILVILAGTALWGSCVLLFIQGWWVPLIPAELALGGSFLTTLGLLRWYDRQ